ncbi:outer membrane protein [Tamlana sp. I1]|uniref:outer membrane protein n=1 Tax=Tamlana sp. I1 TaxID=2762061 RepID=UPI00188F1D9C|nr:hypothetical protein [Tamlana sp. I1]
MKTLLITAVILTTSIFTLNAQSISKNALGVRLGDNDGFGGEISYQRYLKANNRLEFDLGWRDSKNIDAFKLVGLYQWVMPIEGGFNWYVGAGAGVGSFENKNNNDDGAFALVAGDLGIEYNFNIPLMLSLDFRPELGFNDSYNDDLDFDIGLGIRYQF